MNSKPDLSHVIKARSVFKTKVEAHVRDTLTKYYRYYEHSDQVEKDIKHIVLRVCDLVNEHSVSQKVLNRAEKERMARIHFRIEKLKQIIEAKEPLGENVEHYKAELSALEWAVGYIQEHSI